MKMWIDDVRPAPEGYKWIKTVNEAKTHCCQHIDPNGVLQIEAIDLDHDAGEYATYGGGDYIKFLDWLESKDWDCSKVKFHIHSMNPVGVKNMKAIIQHNNWKEGSL